MSRRLRLARAMAAKLMAAAAAAAAAPASADEVWDTDFGALTWLDDMNAHGGAMAVLSYPAQDHIPAGFVSLDNLVGNLGDRGLSNGYWWSYEPSGRRCERPFYDAYGGSETHYYGRVVVVFTDRAWEKSDFKGFYGECMDPPSRPWSGAHR